MLWLTNSFNRIFSYSGYFQACVAGFLRNPPQQLLLLLNIYSNIINIQNDMHNPSGIINYPYEVISTLYTLSAAQHTSTKVMNTHLLHTLTALDVVTSTTFVFFNSGSKKNLQQSFFYPRRRCIRCVVFFTRKTQMSSTPTGLQPPGRLFVTLTTESFARDTNNTTAWQYLATHVHCTVWLDTGNLVDVSTGSNLATD